MVRLTYLDVFHDNPYGTNCWLLASRTSEGAVVVDPGYEPETIHAMLDGAGVKPVAVLLTHAHSDHAWQAGVFAGDLPVYIHEADALAFADPVAWGEYDDTLEPAMRETCSPSAACRSRCSTRRGTPPATVASASTAT
jgi:glyoxylase-like metal-dependent hydrolase (beta-lactamase superfamily II)